MLAVFHTLSICCWFILRVVSMLIGDRSVLPYFSEYHQYEQEDESILAFVNDRSVLSLSATNLSIYLSISILLLNVL